MVQQRELGPAVNLISALHTMERDYGHFAASPGSNFSHAFDVHKMITIYNRDF